MIIDRIIYVNLILYIITMIITVIFINGMKFFFSQAFLGFTRVITGLDERRNKIETLVSGEPETKKGSKGDKKDKKGKKK